MLLLGEFLIKFPDFFTKLLFSATTQNTIVLSMFGEKVQFWAALMAQQYRAQVTDPTRRVRFTAESERI